jgi:hypothetical protein
MTWHFDRGRAEQYQQSIWFKQFIRMKHPFGSIRHITDIARQREGVDLEIRVGEVLVDAWEIKFREQEWQDILIEWRHDHYDGSVRDGWIECELQCKTFAYCFVQTKRLLLMPWVDLQSAWRSKRDVWLKQFGERRSNVNNVGYETVSTPVPINILRQSVPIEDLLISWICHCGASGTQGRNVALTRGQEGQWFCDRHAPADCNAFMAWP